MKSGAGALDQDGRLRSPSLVALAVAAIRKKILAGDLEPGQRLLEEQLTRELDISRPPLREALRLLENEGLITTRPRRGTFVTTLTQHDVYEILTLRTMLERMSIELGMPVRDPSLLAPARAALGEMEQAADTEDRGALVEAGYLFHSRLLRIAEHGRLEEIYASVQQQLLLCMSRNLVVRERYFEDLHEHVARHRKLLELVESGDVSATLAELAVHGERSFYLGRVVAAGGTSPEL
jgi:DNA-binding GntR family transcriptional regulator